MHSRAARDHLAKSRRGRLADRRHWSHGRTGEEGLEVVVEPDDRRDVRPGPGRFDHRDPDFDREVMTRRIGGFTLIAIGIGCLLIKKRGNEDEK